MPVTIPERAGVGDCERCLKQQVEVIRRAYEVEVRDWWADGRKQTHTVVLVERICDDCNEGLTRDAD